MEKQQSTLSSRLPRLKLTLNGQKRSYSLTNIAPKRWFSEESFPSKLLRKSFQKSKIPEPCDPKVPSYRSLRSTNSKSYEVLPREDPLVASFPSPEVVQVTYSTPAPIAEKQPWKPPRSKSRQKRSLSANDGYSRNETRERTRLCCRNKQVRY